MTLWTPASSGAPAQSLWFDAHDTSSITQSGGTVSQWNDKSGNTNHATQATGSLQLAYDSTAAGNLGALVGGGGSSQKYMDLTSSLTTGTTWTAFIVAKMTTQTVQSYMIAASGKGFYAGGNLPADFGVYDGSAYREKTLATNPTIYNAMHILGYSPGTLWVDGTAVGSYVGGSSNVGSMVLSRLFSRNDQTTLYFAGEVYEVIWVPSTLSTSDREYFEGYLAWKWGIQGNLAGGHQFSGAAPTESGSGVSASFAVTDRPDAAAITAAVQVQASFGVTDRPDAAAITADVSTQAALATTDRPDAAAVSATFVSGQTAALSTVEPPDGSAWAANVSTAAALATTEAPDAAAVSATFVVPLNASIAVTDQPDAAAVNVTLLGVYAVTVAASEAPDSFSGAAHTYPWHSRASSGGLWRPVPRPY